MFSYKAVRIQLPNNQEIFSFEDKNIAESVFERLSENNSNSIRNLRKELPKYQQMWANGWLSNFDYLMFLNKLANRSFCDISQYPVMPWVLKQYDSSELDLENPRVKNKLYYFLIL